MMRGFYDSPARMMNHQSYAPCFPERVEHIIVSKVCNINSFNALVLPIDITKVQLQKQKAMIAQNKAVIESNNPTKRKWARGDQEAHRRFFQCFAMRFTPDPSQPTPTLHVGRMTGRPLFTPSCIYTNF